MTYRERANPSYLNIVRNSNWFKRVIGCMGGLGLAGSLVACGNTSSDDSAQDPQQTPTPLDAPKSPDASSTPSPTTHEGNITNANLELLETVDTEEDKLVEVTGMNQDQLVEKSEAVSDTFLSYFKKWESAYGSIDGYPDPNYFADEEPRDTEIEMLARIIEGDVAYTQRIVSDFNVSAEELVKYLAESEDKLKELLPISTFFQQGLLSEPLPDEYFSNLRAPRDVSALNRDIYAMAMAYRASQIVASLALEGQIILGQESCDTPPADKVFTSNDRSYGYMIPNEAGLIPIVDGEGDLPTRNVVSDVVNFNRTIFGLSAATTVWTGFDSYEQYNCGPWAVASDTVLRFDNAFRDWGGKEGGQSAEQADEYSIVTRPSAVTNEEYDMFMQARRILDPNAHELHFAKLATFQDLQANSRTNNPQLSDEELAQLPSSPYTYWGQLSADENSFN